MNHFVEVPVLMLTVATTGAGVLAVTIGVAAACPQDRGLARATASLGTDICEGLYVGTALQALSVFTTLLAMVCAIRVQRFQSMRARWWRDALVVLSLALFMLDSAAQSTGSAVEKLRNESMTGLGYATAALLLCIGGLWTVYAAFSMEDKLAVFFVATTWYFCGAFVSTSTYTSHICARNHGDAVGDCAAYTLGSVALAVAMGSASYSSSILLKFGFTTDCAVIGWLLAFGCTACANACAYGVRAAHAHDETGVMGWISTVLMALSGVVAIGARLWGNGHIRPVSVHLSWMFYALSVTFAFFAGSNAVCTWGSDSHVDNDTNLCGGYLSGFLAMAIASVLAGHLAYKQWRVIPLPRIDPHDSDIQTLSRAQDTLLNDPAYGHGRW